MILLPIAVCCDRIPVRRAVSISGDNGSELRTVLRSFKGDGRRTEAARFLIGNMPGKYTLDPASVAGNKMYYDALARFRDANNGYVVSGLYEVADSLEASIGIPSVSPSYGMDLQTIDSDFLISHIDRSVSSWENSPWKDEVPFDVFCEYVLPYRVFDNSSEDVRDYLMEEWADSLEAWHSQEYVNSAHRIISALASGFHIDGEFFRSHAYMTPTPLLNMAHSKAGQCNDLNALAVTLLRSVGIPCGICFIPYWGNSNASHFWTCVIGEPRRKLYDNTQMDFHSVEDELVNESFWFKGGVISDTTGIPHQVTMRKNRTVPKVFMKRYSLNRSSLAMIALEDIPSIFRDPTLLDVTSSYVMTEDVAVNIDWKRTKHKFVYLCCYDPSSFGWTPVTWAESRRNKAIFKDVGINVLYCPAIYESGRMVVCGEPFILGQSGEKRFLRPDFESPGSAELYSKVPLRTNEAFYAMLMRGDRILAGCLSDYSDTVLLSSIDSIPYYTQTLSFSTPVEAKYVIYKTNEDDPKFVGELEFFDIDGISIKGEPFGNPCVSIYPPSNAFDGDRLTYAYLDKRNGNVDYIGLDFGRPRRISSLTYCPRNDDNAIVPGEDYELFYWKDGWCSLGRQKGGADRRLHYSNIPSGALLRIHNHTRGKENRPFTIEDGIQVWW